MPGFLPPAVPSRVPTSAPALPASPGYSPTTCGPRSDGYLSARARRVLPPIAIPPPHLPVSTGSIPEPPADYRVLVPIDPAIEPVRARVTSALSPQPSGG